MKLTFRQAIKQLAPHDAQTGLPIDADKVLAWFKEDVIAMAENRLDYRAETMGRLFVAHNWEFFNE